MGIRKIKQDLDRFRGVFIPKEIWLDENLTLQEVVLLTEIKALSGTVQGAYATNKHYADFLGVGEERVRKIISGLVTSGKLERTLLRDNETKEVTARFLKVRVVENDQTPLLQKYQTPMVEKYRESNTGLSNTNKDNEQTRLLERFSELWKLYPNKKGKEKAFKAYQKAIKVGVEDKTIKKGIENYLAEISHKQTAKQFIKHGATWFGNQGWEDEYDILSTKKPIDPNIQKPKMDDFTDERGYFDDVAFIEAQEAYKKAVGR